MGNFVSPAYGVRAVPIEKIVANSYNPNIMAPPEMRYWNFPFGRMAIRCLASVIILKRMIYMR